VERAHRILDLMASAPTHAYTAAEVATALHIHRATCFALLKSLARLELVSWDPVRKTYGLGPELLRLSNALTSVQPGLPVARQHGYAIARDLDVGVLICMRRGWDMVFVERVGTDPAFGLPDPRYAHVPLAPPHGAIFVAWSTPEEIDEWVRRARPESSSEDLESFRRSVGAIRARGYSIGSDVEYELQLEEVLSRLGSDDLGQRLAAALQLADLVRVAPVGTEARTPAEIVHLIGPVFDALGQVVLTIALFGRPGQVTEPRREVFTERLVDACMDATRAGGGTWPDPLTAGRGRAPGAAASPARRRSRSSST
jgi:DNA-binding IclR family transcriptional regulator